MEKRKSANKHIFSRIVIIISAFILGFAGYRLYDILKDYHQTDVEYDNLIDEYVSSNPTSASDSDPHTDAPASANARNIEDAEPPLTVDWDGLKIINSDIVGWIYVEAEPSISYPVVQYKDNSYYLHRTYKGSYLYAGSIFEDCANARDFSDSATVVYGHNMKSGSMFAKLKHLLSQAVYDSAPYFWILTPQGNYRYHIFSAFTTTQSSFVYELYTENDEAFLKWAQELKKASAVTNDMEPLIDDKIVVLSTCQGAGTEYRNVVCGMCVSSAKPEKES